MTGWFGSMTSGHRGRRGLASLACMAVLFAAVPAQGYVILFDQFGEPRTWGKSTIPWRMGSAGSGDVGFDPARAAVQAAFDAWQAVSCASLGFSYAGAVNSQPGQDIFVAFVENNWDLTTADAAGVTTNWQIGGSGVTRVEIYFNGVNFTWATSGADDPFSDVTDIQAVATHEIGHAIGLDHSRHRTSTMWFSNYPGQSAQMRTLEQDDINGICMLYPAVTFDDGQACDACLTGSQCANGVCFNFGAEGAYCGQDCGAGLPCPEGFTCYNVDGVGTPQCLPDNDHCAPEGGNIALGDFCYGHETCGSSQCLVLPDSAVCTTSCNPNGASTCPSTMTCLGQGSDGVCYPKGTAQLGESCVSSADCADFTCLGIGNSEGVCSQTCSGSGCPSGFLCTDGYCLKPGAGQFGDPCDVPTDCASTVCLPFAGCSKTCANDQDCPGDSTCTASGVCTIAPDGELGDACQDGDCISSLFCFFESADAANGTCAKACDVRFDGCDGAQLCEWVWQGWKNKLVGVCVDDDGGVALGGDCGVGQTCKPSLVCADTDGSGAKCRQDCNATNFQGCASGSKCVPLELADNPKLGACNPTGSTTPDPGVVVEEPTGAELDTSDAGSAGADTSSGPDGEADVMGGTTGSDGSTGGVGGDAGGSAGRRGGAGGCAAAGPLDVPAGPGVALALLLLVLAALKLRGAPGRVSRRGEP